MVVYHWSAISKRIKNPRRHASFRKLEARHLDTSRSQKWLPLRVVLARKKDEQIFQASRLTIVQQQRRCKPVKAKRRIARARSAIGASSRSRAEGQRLRQIPRARTETPLAKSAHQLVRHHQSAQKCAAGPRRPAGKELDAAPRWCQHDGGRLAGIPKPLLTSHKPTVAVLYLATKLQYSYMCSVRVRRSAFLSPSSSMGGIDTVDGVAP